jgi:hypothetical protein
MLNLKKIKAMAEMITGFFLLKSLPPPTTKNGQEKLVHLARISQWASCHVTAIFSLHALFTNPKIQCYPFCSFSLCHLAFLSQT